MIEFEAFANEVVGPIRAAYPHKKAIREELLNHLDEAANHARDQGVALEELTAHVLERFGDVATVRSEIAQSIPALERVLYIRMFDRREGEGDYRYGARMSGYASTMIACFVVFCIAASWIDKGFAVDARLWLLTGPVAVFVLLFGEFVLDMRIRRNVQQGNWGVAFNQAFLNGVALSLVPVLAALATDAVAPGIPHVLTVGTVVGVGLLIFMVPTSLGAAYWASRNCPWIEDLGRDI
jgi:hypothetical protein